MMFNVFRQLDYDFNSSRFWDISSLSEDAESDPRIGFIRAGASIWSRTDRKYVMHQNVDRLQDDVHNVGILLLDPTIQAGHPLWRKTRHWAQAPSMTEPEPIEGDGPPSDNMFEDFLYWATRPNMSKVFDGHAITSPSDFAKSAILHLVCTEWLTLLDYLKTRLNQISWEFSFPGDFLAKDEELQKAFMKLHQWRREVPVFRDMIRATIQHHFEQNRCHRQFDRLADPLGAASRCTLSGHYKEEFTRIQGRLDEVQERIDCLDLRGSECISANPPRYYFTKRLIWLVWMAIIFFPLSYVISMLSMTTAPLAQLGASIKVWLVVALPMLLVIMGAYMRQSRSRYDVID